MICLSVRVPPRRDAVDGGTWRPEEEGEYSSGPEYWAGWSVRKEKELELSQDDDAPDMESIWESASLRTKEAEEPSVFWLDGSSTPWMVAPANAGPSWPSKLRIWPMLQSSPATALAAAEASTTEPSPPRGPPDAKQGVARPVAHGG